MSESRQDLEKADPQIKEEIDRILAVLERQESGALKGGLYACLAGGAVGALVGFVLLAHFSPGGQPPPPLFSLVFALMCAAIGGLVVGGLLLEIAENDAAKSYRQAFPEGSDQRPAGDRVLAAMESRSQAGTLRIALGIKTEVQQKREQEVGKKAPNTVTPSFQCGGCLAEIDVSNAGKFIKCRRCGAYLRFKKSLPCPYCGGHSSTSPIPMDEPAEVSFAPAERGHAYKIAGGLIGGVPGFIVGSVIDATAREVKNRIRRAGVRRLARRGFRGAASKTIGKPVYGCRSCGRIWALVLPVVSKDQASGRRRPHRQKTGRSKSSEVVTSEPSAGRGSHKS